MAPQVDKANLIDKNTSQINVSINDWLKTTHGALWPCIPLKSTK